MHTPNTSSRPVVAVRPLQESDLEAADKIFRLAFGTFIGLPDPTRFAQGSDFVSSRWRADPLATLGAVIDGELVGSNFVTRWGSVGFFGPLTVRPDFWDRGVASQLLQATMDLFTKWQITHAGLYTFAVSPKHSALYQKFGFWPRFLTALTSRPVRAADGEPQLSTYSSLAGSERAACLEQCRTLTSEIYQGLDVNSEIRAVDAQRLGETVLVFNEGKLEAFAVCHCGPGTEAEPDACYVKFGAARPGSVAPHWFNCLLTGCEALAAQRRLAKVVAGVNTARHEAYKSILQRGYGTTMQGLVMEKPNEPGYNRPEVFLIDDWR